MYEKVNPSHPDKLADRIAGALVDMAYRRRENPRIAVEVLLGHSECHIIAETSVRLDWEEVYFAAHRIAGKNMTVHYQEVPQDEHLRDNQSQGFRCGDNGIFKGMPVTDEQRKLSDFMRGLYEAYPYDGKAVSNGTLILCQSNAKVWDLAAFCGEHGYPTATINPLGDWTGGSSVDCGATNRKLGSDMGDAVTGGGLHGKDLSKADVSVNVYAHILAQQLGKPQEFSCAIGDEFIGDTPYSRVVEIARDYIERLGGFERFAEWGLV
jgi:S-adenosylmethionine synthetase